MRLLSAKFLPSLILTAASSCVFVTTQPAPVARPESGQSVRVRSAAKAHLADGSLVVYPKGFVVRADTIRSQGMRYDLCRRGDARGVQTLPLDSVSFIEEYQLHLDVPTLLASLPAAAGAVAVALNPKILFGSCPTIYSWDRGAYTLEAEGFSYSLSRLMQAYDLDRLDIGPDSSGAYRLMLANEALETHYVNSLDLLLVGHAQSVEPMTSDNGRIIGFRLPQARLFARSRSGRDVSAEVGSRDNRWYLTDSALAARLPDSVVHDWLDLSIPVPSGARRMVLALRFRNTLLNTVLLYDEMLGSQGVRALDWEVQCLNNIPYVLHLSRWYDRHFGLHVKTPAGSRMRELVRIRDTGPLAWHLTAIELPVTSRDTVRLRLETIADNVVIDWIGASFDPADCEPILVECRDVRGPGNSPRLDVLPLIRRKDNHYLVTKPGDNYVLTFRPGPEPGGESRSWFVKTSGYYTEWLRPEWFGQDAATRFEPADVSLQRAALTWLKKKPELERRFYELKVPIARNPQ